MKDDSGRVAWLWGPLFLVALLVVVFRFAEIGGVGFETGDSRGGSSSPIPAGPSPGAALAAPMSGGEARPPGGVFAPVPGVPPAPYAAGPAPYPGVGACPPWAGYGWPPSYPRPGDHSGRYWGSRAAEWGPPVGEYGPETRVDPYWWVAAEDTDR